MRRGFKLITNADVSLTTSYKGLLNSLGIASNISRIVYFEIVNDSGNSIYLSFDGTNQFIEIKSGEIYSLDETVLNDALWMGPLGLIAVKDLYLKGTAGGESYRVILKAELTI